MFFTLSSYLQSTSEKLHEYYQNEILGRVVTNESDLDEDEIIQWKIWLNEVFMPINTAQEKIITENSFLILEDEFPDEFVKFLAHVNEYKVIVKNWNDETGEKLFTSIKYPREMKDYIYKSFRKLKKKQNKYIEKV